MRYKCPVNGVITSAKRKSMNIWERGKMKTRKTNHKKSILKFVLTASFFAGLFLIFGTAGYGDLADELGEMVALGFFIRRFVLGICLMLPLSIFFGFGGSFDGDDESI